MAQKYDLLLSRIAFISINDEACRHQFPKHVIQVFDMFFRVIWIHNDIIHVTEYISCRIRSENKLIKVAKELRNQKEPSWIGTFWPSKVKAAHTREDSSNGICRKALLRSIEEMCFAPWNLCNSSWASAVFALSRTICLLTCLAFTHIRTGLCFLCIIVRGLTYDEWEFSKILLLINIDLFPDFTP